MVLNMPDNKYNTVKYSNKIIQTTNKVYIITKITARV